MNAAIEKPRLRIGSGEKIEAAMSRVGAYDAADSMSRELMTWDVSSLSGDAAILPAKDKTTNRTKDLIRNNGYAAQMLQLRTSTIVGHNFKLSYAPNWSLLGLNMENDSDKKVAREFVREVEARWIDLAEDPSCPLDAEGTRTFTQMIRAGVFQELTHGEILRSAEYINRPGIRTAIKMINPDRLCNPDLKPDSILMRAGVTRNRRGAAQVYHIRENHHSDSRFMGMAGAGQVFKWKPVRSRTPWGRQQIIHIFDALEDGQTRGISKLAPVLERFKMLDKWQKVKLQADIVNAMYAVVIESEFDTETALSAIGGSNLNSENNPLTGLLKAKSAYHKNAGVTLDGSKLAHLFPGEKLHLLQPNAANDSQLEDRLLRYIAAGGHFSYEQLSSNWSQTNYSSARASLGESFRYVLGERELHKRDASSIFALVLEEMFSKGIIKPPRGCPGFYEAKNAWCRADWIGPGKSMIDGLKEVKEIVLLLEANLITYKSACARLGEDYKDVLDQQIIELEERKSKGLPLASWAQTQVLAPDAHDENPDVNTNSQTA
jgi:lambda family phage portal protein